FFFSSRRRHTRFSRDWSSDVCSSDLAVSPRNGQRLHSDRGLAPADKRCIETSLAQVQNFAISLDGFGTGEGVSRKRPFGHADEQIGRASCRERVWITGGPEGGQDTSA